MVDFKKLSEKSVEEREAERRAFLEEKEKEMRDLQDTKISDLCSIDDGLNDWEVGFVESVARQYERTGSLTEKQWAKIDVILEEKG